MKFCFDAENDNRMWVDRAGDGRLDSFEPCEPCLAIAEVQTAQEPGWHDLSLCQPCRTDLAIEAAFTDLMGTQKPLRYDQEALRIGQPDIWREKPPPNQGGPALGGTGNYPW